MTEKNKNTKLDIHYFTDPLCSYCWLFEPYLKRFIYEYGDYFNLKIHMGGLIGSYEGFEILFDDNTSPDDMKDHWESLSLSFHMPIDGSIWLKSPLKSSYPASFVYLHLKKHFPAYAEKYLREVKFSVFVENKPTDKDEILSDILIKIGLENASEILINSKGSDILEIMHEDINLGKLYKIQGYPSLVILNPDIDLIQAKNIILFGVRSYNYYVDGLLKALNEFLHEGKLSELEISKKYPAKKIPDLKEILLEQPVFYAKEISVLYSIELDKVIEFCSDNLDVGTYTVGSVLGETFISAVF